MQAFVVQEGFVYSRMLEVFTCTWICIACILLFTALMWGTLLWQLPLLSASLSAYVPLRCESMLWLFPLIVNLPIMLSLDTVSSTSIFKEAAVKKGYPGVAFFHVNFNARFVLLVLNAAGFWLVDLVTEALGQHGAQWRVYRLYALIAQAGAYTLFLFMLLPRWTNMCKSREAMLKLKEEGVSKVDKGSKWRPITSGRGISPPDGLFTNGDQPGEESEHSRSQSPSWAAIPSLVTAGQSRRALQLSEDAAHGADRHGDGGRAGISHDSIASVTVTIAGTWAEDAPHEAERSLLLGSFDKPASSSTQEPSSRRRRGVMFSEATPSGTSGNINAPQEAGSELGWPVSSPVARRRRGPRISTSCDASMLKSRSEPGHWGKAPLPTPSRLQLPGSQGDQGRPTEPQLPGAPTQGFNPRVARISETSDFTGSPGIDSATNCSPQPSSLAPGRRRAPFRGKALTFTSAQDVKHMIQAATTKVQAPPARGASIAWTEASCVASETPRNPKARAVMAATLGAEPTYRNAQVRLASSPLPFLRRVTYGDADRLRHINVTVYGARRFSTTVLS